MENKKSDSRQEKVIDTIRKLLNLADTSKNPSEAEAVAAALKAQKLMAQYNIDIAEVKSVDDIVKQEINEECITFVKNSGYNTKWRFTLSHIVADNFRVKTFTYGKDAVVFYGYKTDTQIARQVFQYLFTVGNKLSVKYYYKCQKAGRETRGVINEFLMGYCQGLKDVLEKQCVALMIVTPQEVLDKYSERSKNFTTFSAKVTRSGDRQAWEDGRTEGRFAANSRSLEEGEKAAS